MSRKYPQVRDGEWVKPIMRGYKMRCCDCSLVHRINFKVKKAGKGHRILLQAFRDERATAASRRKLQKNK